MQVQSVLVNENDVDIMTTIQPGENIEIIISATDRIAAVFFGEVEFEVRLNKFVLETIEKLHNATPLNQVLALQVLQHLAIKEVEYAKN